MSEIPQQRKTAPASSGGAEVYYGERNTGIRMVSTGKVDEAAEAARKALIRSMGKKPGNSVADRWSAPKEKTQKEKIEETGDRRISSSHNEYEKRRMSRVEQRKAELEKIAKEKEKEDKERMERIKARREERRLSSTGSANLDRFNKLSIGSEGEVDGEKERQLVHKS